jgi:hypothetical protein
VEFKTLGNFGKLEEDLMKLEKSLKKMWKT